MSQPFLHKVLVDGFEAEQHASLVRTHWARRAALSLRGGLLLFIVLEMLRSEPA